jgi:hypothetical protein
MDIEGTWHVVTWRRGGTSAEVLSIEFADPAHAARVAVQLAEQGRTEVAVIDHQPGPEEAEVLRQAFVRGRERLFGARKVDAWLAGASPSAEGGVFA